MTPALQKEIAARIARSEALHSGQIAVYVEGGLPNHYIRADRTARERAWGLFGKLGVWDTAQNNGVLIYLLIAEHAIEIVADRGLQKARDNQALSLTVEHLRQALQAGDYAGGLRLAIDEVGVLLQQEFARREGTPAAANELPDTPHVS